MSKSSWVSCQFKIDIQPRAVIATTCTVLLRCSLTGVATFGRNVRFRFLIEQNLDRYENHKKHDKKIVAVEILNAIRERGGRFLTATDEGWIECDEITAREKVSSCFRSLRKVKGHGASGGAEVQEFSLKRNLLVGQTTTDNATELS